MTYAIHSGILGVPCFLLLSVHRPSYQDPHNSSLHSSLKSFRRVWDRGSSDFFWKVSVASTGHSLRKDAGSQEGNAKLSELGPTTLQEKSLHCSSQWSSSNFAGGGGSCNIEAASGERLVREMQEWRCKMLGPSPSACIDRLKRMKRWNVICIHHNHSRCNLKCLRSQAPKAQAAHGSTTCPSFLSCDPFQYNVWCWATRRLHKWNWCCDVIYQGICGKDSGQKPASSKVFFLCAFSIFRCSTLTNLEPPWTPVLITVRLPCLALRVPGLL